MGQSYTHFFYKEILLHILIANFLPGFLRPLFIKIISIFGLSQKRKSMCFSPEASFAGGVVLISIGVATARRIQKPSQLLFAMIPIFFGLQQLAEGFVWVSLQNPEYFQVQKVSTMAYLIFAQVFWPVYIPLAVLLMEENQKRKRILKVFLVTGIVVFLYYTFCLIYFDVYPQIEHYHIRYYKGFPKFLNNPALAIYLISTLVPLFISTIKGLRYFGALMFFSCLVTAIFYTQYLTSVWCFFAAIISVVIYWIIRDLNRKSVG